MAARSTRQKIRDQAEKMVKSCRDVAFHMKNLSDLADGRSNVVNAYVKIIIQLEFEFEAVLTQFRNQL